MVMDMLKNKIMLKVTISGDNNNFYNFQIIKTDCMGKISKSNRFIVTIDKILDLLDNKYIVDQDLNNFAKFSINTYDGELNIKLFWLKVDSNNNITGINDNIIIDLNTFISWYKSDYEDVGELKILPKVNKKVCKFVFRSKKLKEIINNKILKKKLVKQLISLSSWNIDEISIYDDFADYSFGFTSYLDNSKDITGGIIFHRDYKNPNCLENGHYSVHT
jgi:hypothetical protein